MVEPNQVKYRSIRLKNYSRKIESWGIIVDKALLYVRVSSKPQEEEGYSLDAQMKLGEEYAKKKKLKIVKRWRGSESAWTWRKDLKDF